MSLLSRSLRRSVVSLLCLLPGVCAAQQAQQFVSVPAVELTGGRVTSFLTGTFQQPPNRTDILYINAPVAAGTSSSVTVGELLSGQGAQGFTNLTENQITFPNVTSVVAALGNFSSGGIADYAFALTPTVPGAPNLCLYAGSGLGLTPPGSYSGGNVYPPAARSGCTTLHTLGSFPPTFGYIAAFPFKTGLAPQLIVEDTANNYLYIVSVGNATASNGVLSGVQITSIIALAPADGPGPISIGDFNRDGNTDFIVNGLTGFTATVYSCDGAGRLFGLQSRYDFTSGVAAYAHVHSMLMHDMDRDGIPDMVIETDSGQIAIHKGNGDGTFATAIEGGSVGAASSLAGYGGHLAAINPTTLDILTTTPVGLSLLRNVGGLNYIDLKAIYDIGPGRSSFAMADFYGTSNLDLAVDSPEGVAIIAGNPDGTFQTSKAYPSLSPALGTVVGKFRNANNPSGNLDVVVDTGAIQAQLLTGNGDGTFNTYPGVVVTSPPNFQNLSPPPPGVWSNILSGDFDGDGNLDVLYSLTGLPQTPPSGISALTSYIQYGNGDGTFSQSGNTLQVGVLSSNPNGLYLETATGDFNGDSVSDFAVSDAYFDGVWLGIRGNRSTLMPGPSNADSNNTDFSQVASGFFKLNRTSQQDVVFQQGASFIPFVNKQDGTGKNFTAMTALTGPTAPLYATTVLLTDLDGDGTGDLIVVYYNTTPNPVGAGPVAPYQVCLWWGNGDGTFVPTPLILNLGRNYYLGAVADLNGDGRPDLVLSDGSLVSILYNQGNRNFGNPQGNGLLSSEAHYLAGQGINSISIADVNGDGEPDLILANGGVTVSNPIVLGGETAASLTLTPNPDVNTGGITVLLNSVSTKPVTGTLIAAPEPSNYGATFTLTATLAPTAGVAVPTGTVQFSIDGITVGNPVAVAPGSATSTATYVVPAGNTYTAGSHPLTAIYSGDAVNSPLPLLATHSITNATTPPMIESLAARPEPSNFGASFTLIADLTPVPGVPEPTGVVTFFLDGVPVGTGNLAPVPGSTSSEATFTIPVGNVYPVGFHALSFSYSGDTANSPVTFVGGNHLIAGTTTTQLNLCVGPSVSCPSNGFVNPPFQSTLPMIYGQVYNGTATVTASDGGPLPGTTLFFDAYNGAPPLLLCTLQTQQGGTCPPSVGIGAQVGTHIFTAVYAPGPNDTHTGSTSPTVTIFVTQDTTTATLTGAPNPSPASQPVTFVATLTGSAAPPTGTVVFSNGATVLGTVALVASTTSFTSTATLTTSTLPVGTDTITLTYAATLNFAAASATTTETITPLLTGSFTLAITPAPVSVAVGYAALLKVTVTPQNGFAQAVNLACSNLPTEATCFFDSPQIAAGGGSTQAIVFTTAPHTCGTTQPYFYGSNGTGPGIAPFALPTLAGVLVLFLPGKRRWLRALVALLVVAGATHLTGCGTCTDLGTRPATYTFRITGTAATTTEVESQPVTMTVTL